MKKTLCVLMILSFLTVAACQKKGKSEGETAKLDNSVKKNSYAVGHEFAKNFIASYPEADVESIVHGIRDAATKNAKPLLNAEEIQKTMTEFNQEMMKRETEKQKAMAEKNKSLEENFLAANAKKEGFKSTASGLQYKVITEGKGARPKATDAVKVHYRGTLMDGREFDSSYKRGEAAIFPLDRVIPGWREGVQLMTVGSKYILVMPSKIAYGERGAGEVIPPNSPLVFEVELLSIEANPQK